MTFVNAALARMRCAGSAALSHWTAKNRLVVTGDLTGPDDVLPSTRDRFDPKSKDHRASKLDRPKAESRALRDHSARLDVDLTPDAYPELTEACLAAREVSCEIENGANDLAHILCRHLPLNLAKTIVTEWVHVRRWGYVGAANDFQSISRKDEWLPPPTGGVWGRHIWFTREALTDVEWQEAAAKAAEWRSAESARSRIVRASALK